MTDTFRVRAVEAPHAAGPAPSTRAVSSGATTVRPSRSAGPEPVNIEDAATTTPDAGNETQSATSGSPPMPTRFVFLDTEATGLDEVRHELTEIAWIVRFENGHEVERQYFPSHTLDAADESALELTAYHERIASKPRTPMAVWLTQFLEDARGAVIVGAVPDFDVRHLLKSCRKLNISPTWDHHLVDIGTLALPLIAPGPEAPRSLARTCEALGIPHDRDQAHGALYDAQQVRRVFDALWSLLAELRVADKPLPPPVPRQPLATNNG